MGPVHEGFHILQVAGSEAGDEFSRDLEIFWRCEESYNRIFGGETVPRERMVVLQETADEGMEEESLKCGGRISQV